MNVKFLFLISKMVKSLLLFSFVYSIFLYASPNTYGYFETAPNQFWPNTAFAGLGNSIQQKTAANNPDYFCNSQGNGYRLPSAGEMNSTHMFMNPRYARTTATPGHWSTYVNNDINLGKRPNVSGRLVNNSIYNEWGNLSAYGNGWMPGNYWVTEPTHHKPNDTSWYDATIGRLSMNASTGVFPDITSRIDQPNPIELATVLRFVSCVRDLIPTPSTPNPSFS